MADHPAPLTASQIEDVFSALPPPTVKPERSASQTFRSETSRDAAGKNWRKFRLSGKLVRDLYGEFLYPKMLAEAAY